MLNNRSLKFRLTFAFGLVALIIFVVGGIGAGSLSRVRTQYSQVTEVVTPKLIHLTQMRWSMEKLLSIITQMGLYGNSPDDLKKLNEELNSARHAYTEAEKSYQSLKISNEEKVLYDKVAEKWGTVLGFLVDALPLARSSETKDKIAFAALYRGEFKNARAQFYENLAFLIQFQKQASDAYLQTVQITSQKCVTAMTIFAVIGFFASLGVGMFSSKNLSTQLSSLANQLSNSAGQLSSSSSDLATASEQLLSSIDGQTSAIYETSTSMDEMNSMVNKSSENASHSQKVSVNSDDSARSSQKSMNEMLRAMDELDKSINTLTVQTESNIQSFSEINRVISEIGNKTKVINDIVFQTKLLSFNASVEAARAGEHGKGFSVVAEEVGNLAQHSGNAAQEIQNMINSSISNVSQIVSRSKSEIESIIRINREKVESGKTIATECGKSLEEVVTNVGRVRAMIDEISTAAKEQAIGIGEVTKTMAVLSQGTQQNAEVSKRASHASEQVAQQADDLRQMVTQLLHSIYGNKTATTQKQDQERPSGKTKGAGETSSKNPNMAA